VDLSADMHVISWQRWQTDSLLAAIQSVRAERSFILSFTLCGRLIGQKTHRGGLGLCGSVHEEAHHCFPYFTRTPLKSIDAGSTNCPLIQLILSDDYSMREKIDLLTASHVHRNLASFHICPLVPLMLSSKVKSSFNSSLDSPLHIFRKLGKILAIPSLFKCPKLQTL